MARDASEPDDQRRAQASGEMAARRVEASRLWSMLTREGRRLGPLFRYAAATLLVLASAAVRYLLLGPAPGFPYVAFFPAVLACALFLGRGAGVYAAALGAATAVAMFGGPWHGSARLAAIVDAVLFLAVALFTAGIASSLRGAHAELAEAHAQAVAGEREKDLLLAELTHRTRNDIHRVAGLLRLQASSAVDGALAEALRSAASRVEITARLHERLARRDGAVVVDSREFLAQVAEDLREGLGGLRPIRLIIEAEAHPLSYAKATALGLVCNELVTNALKHAFPDDRTGRIQITFRRLGAEFEFTVADDGIGAQDEARPGGPENDRGRIGLGRRLVRALTAQLGGQLNLTANMTGGTVCTLSFPANASLREAI